MPEYGCFAQPAFLSRVIPNSEFDWRIGQGGRKEFGSGLPAQLAVVATTVLWVSEELVGPPADGR